MRREAKTLLEKSLDSLVLSVEHFNRPWDRGRKEAVLILLDRAFELQLKAAILHKGGSIREKQSKETIGFSKSVRVSITAGQTRFMKEEEAVTPQIINSLRDAAQHHVVDISEQQLYLYSQAGITLYDSILQRVFGKKLADFVPDRVLPICPKPPLDLEKLLDVEFAEIKHLVKPGSRKRLPARSKLRAFAIVDASLGGERSLPSEAELGRFLARVQKGEDWKAIFPGIANLKIAGEGEGIYVSLRITKKDGEPVRLVPEGTPGSTVVAVKRVNELDYYSLGFQDILDKVSITSAQLLAVIDHLSIRKSEDYYKEFRFKSQKIKRYSPKALETIQSSLRGLDLEKVWTAYREKRRAA
jgi:hypothetical protein